MVTLCECPKAYIYLGGLGLTYTEAQSENFDALIEAKVFEPYRTKRSSTPLTPSSIAIDIDAVVAKVITALVPKLQDIVGSKAENIIAQLKPLVASTPPFVHVGNMLFNVH